MLGHLNRDDRCEVLAIRGRLDEAVEMANTIPDTEIKDMCLGKIARAQTQ